MIAILELDVITDELVCSSDGCSRRYRFGWGEVCEDCALTAQDHEDGLHVTLAMDCPDCR